MKLLILAAALSLTACTAVPLTVKFPDVPPSLMEACGDLEQQAPTDRLSDVLMVVVGNYSQYHECQLKVTDWQDWHRRQKEIFENIK